MIEGSTSDLNRTSRSKLFYTLDLADHGYIVLMVNEYRGQS